MHIEYIAIYALLALAGVLLHLRRRRRHERAAAAAHEAAQRAGLAEPASLHPVVDPARCIGSGGCTRACPEGALGMVAGRAALVNGAACIGHGACAAACPVEAITLVFGTERRGVDIPTVSPQFESNVPGIFIAGELGGMGLIRKAAEQGRQAIDAIRGRRAHDDQLHVVIVGAGPAGISAALAAQHHGLRYRLIEQEESLGGAVYHYPRNKIAMTAPVKLAIVGTVRMTEVSKEKLLEFWQRAVAKAKLAPHFRERMERVEPAGDGFVVHTTAGSHRTRSVLLAIGRRGSPRRLGVPGEDLPKVVYRLVDPEQYRGMQVLVVGGGDSALEAAIALAAQPATAVRLAYRGDAFNRVKDKNRQQLLALAQEGRIDVLLGTEVDSITPTHVHLRDAAQTREVPNDAVIVCAGGVLPIPLLQQMGIEFQTKYGSV